ncbi:MAG: tyrosine-type recombinase/integrase [Sphaerochaeta sp.]|jgi:integrase|nr:tyrosine-type recombinase/integrase [Sphaerochaeta sp.]MCI2103768.1 tyrosine-type recombinase/integrase [Sphaerochaeta sp.]
MGYEFKSPFAPDIEGFIGMKVQTGYKEGTYKAILADFDSFALRHFPGDDVLTEEIYTRWRAFRPGEKGVTVKHRISKIRMFSHYQKLLGKDAYVVPDRDAPKTVRFLPFIYTDDELAGYFAAADTFAENHHTPEWEYVVPVILRVMFCCGLRPFEARLLLVSDMNLKDGLLTVRKSKFGKSRTIPMDESVRRLCARYDCLIRTRVPQRCWFFENPYGGPYGRKWLSRINKACFMKAGIKPHMGRFPRPYDARHTFVFHVIAKWSTTGIDVDRNLPFLSVYLGHEDTLQTEYYINILCPSVGIRSHMKWQECPEVFNYDEEND